MENNLDRNALSCYSSLSQHLLKSLHYFNSNSEIDVQVYEYIVKSLKYNMWYNIYAYVIEYNLVLLAHTYRIVKRGNNCTVWNIFKC